MNGIAGAYSEMVPIVNIVGMPATVLQQEKAVLHHTLGNGDFTVFTRMYRHVCSAIALLTVENAPREIDRVILECKKSLRPGMHLLIHQSAFFTQTHTTSLVYIGLPLDIMEESVPFSKQTMLPPLRMPEPKVDPESLEAAIQGILTALDKAKYPVIIIDACTVRHGLQEQALEFVNKSGVPVFDAPMGKGVISKEHPQYRGTYAGSVSIKQVKDEFEGADLVISIGNIIR